MRQLIKITFHPHRNENLFVIITKTTITMFISIHAGSHISLVSIAYIFLSPSFVMAM